MTGSRRAIVAPIAGTTRDALARPVVWRGTSFQLFDTGGLYGETKIPLHARSVQQVATRYRWRPTCSSSWSTGERADSGDANSRGELPRLYSDPAGDQQDRRQRSQNRR